MFVKVRDYIVERGLKECRELLERGEGKEGFYLRAMDGFQRCREFENLASLQEHIRVLEVKELDRDTDYAFRGLPRELKECWYWRGYLWQLEFVRDRLVLLKHARHHAGPPVVTSAMAVMDMLQEVLVACS